MPPVPFVSHMTSRTLLAMCSMSSCISMTKQFEKLGVARARVDERRARGEVLERRHLLVEGDGVARGVGLVEREAHRHAHPEVLGSLEGLTVARLDAVAVVEGDDTDVLEQVVVRGVESGGERLEVEGVGEPGVEQVLAHTALDVRGEVLAVQISQLIGRGVVAEHALVDGLEQEACGDGVERRVVLHVLQSDLDDGLIELLGRDAVEERELKLARDLRHPRDVVVEALRGMLDGEVDLVGVVRLSASIALDNGDAHVAHSPSYAVVGAILFSMRLEPSVVRKSPESRADRAIPPARFHHYIAGLGHS